MAVTENFEISNAYTAPSAGFTKIKTSKKRSSWDVFHDLQKCISGYICRMSLGRHLIICLKTLFFVYINILNSMAETNSHKELDLTYKTIW